MRSFMTQCANERVGFEDCLKQLAILAAEV
jgi:hypothetical protein